MSSIRYLRKSGELVADFAERKEAPWKDRWVPSNEHIHEGSTPVRIIKVVSVPSTIEFGSHLNPNQVTLEVEFDNEEHQNVKATSITLSTDVLGPVTGTAHYDSLSISFQITVVAPVVLDSITVSSDHRSFMVNDPFIEEVVTAHYTDSSSKVVTGATFSGYDMSTTGTQTVTVAYVEGEITKTTTYEIVVA